MADFDGVLKNIDLERKDLNLKCQRNIRDRIADEIIGDWYRVGRTLDVSDAKMNCILHDNVSLTSPADKAVAVLDAWAVEKGSGATCLKLAEALFSHNKVRTIEILCEEVTVKRDSTTSEPSTSAAVSHQTGDNQQQQQGDNMKYQRSDSESSNSSRRQRYRIKWPGRIKYQNYQRSDSEASNPASLKRYWSGESARSDSLQSESSVEGYSSLSGETDVDERIKSLDEHYRKLFSDMRSEFASNEKITPEDLLDTVHDLPIELKDEYQSFLNRNEQRLEKAEKIREIFRVLNIELRFTDCGFIANLIEGLGSKDLKQKLSQYKQSVDMFLKETTVEHIIKSEKLSGVSKDNCNIPEGFMVLKAEIMEGSSSYSLEELEKLRRDFCGQLRLAEVIVCLKGAKEFRSFLVVWLFPEQLEKKVIKGVKCLETCFVLRKQIYLIMVGDKIFEPQDDNCGTMVYRTVSPEHIKSTSSISHEIVKPEIEAVPRNFIEEIPEHEFWTWLKNKGMSEKDTDILKENGINPQCISAMHQEDQHDFDELEELGLSASGMEVLLEILKATSSESMEHKQDEGACCPDWLRTTFNFVKIQQEFSTIVVELLALLEEHCVNTSEVHHYLKKVISFSHSSSPDFAPLSYDDIFHSDVWVYDNMFPLNCVANKFLPNTHMKVHIQEYAANLLQFRRSTKIIDFNDKCRNLASSALGKSSEIVCVYYNRTMWQNMQVKLDVRDEISSLHLSNIDDISSKLCQHLSFSDGESLLTINNINKADVILNWRIPVNAMCKINQPRMETLEVLSDQNILLISSEDCVLFDRSMVSDQLGLLKHCKKGNSSDCLSILKQKVKLNINLCDKERKSPLWHACRNGLTDVVELLLKRGSVIESKDMDSKTPLWIASWYGKADVVKLLISYKAKINSKSKDGKTPLHIACVHNKIDVMKALINEGADVNVQEKLNLFSPLHDASHLGHYEAVKILVRSGSQVDIKAEESLTPLHLSCREGCAQIAEYLIQSGAFIESLNEDSKTPLWIASFYGKADVVKVLISHKAKINSKSKNGWSPVHAACQEGHTNVVQLLLENNAVIDEENLNLSTPLHIASQEGQSDISHLLINWGANMDKKNKYGNAPLHIASYKGRLSVANVLIANGAKVDIVNKEDKTPLWKASYYGQTEIVELFLKNNAQPNLSENNGWTPLHAASQQGHDKVVEVLVKYGAEVNVLNNNGWSPLQVASQHGHTAVAKVLLDGDAQVDFQTKMGWTGLHIATQEGHYDFVELLIQYHANFNLETKNGWTPLHVAAQDNRGRITELLINNGADPSIVNKDGQSPLHVACEKGNAEVAMVYFSKRPDLINLKNKAGFSPFWTAVYSGKNNIVQPFLTGANINEIDSDGWSVLHIASELGHTDIIDVLAEDKRLQIDIKDKNGKTPLWIASFHGKTDVVKTLLKYGANPLLQNENGWNSFHISCQRGHLDVVDVFIDVFNKREMSVDIETKDGKSPLIIGSLYGQGRIVEKLVGYKADLNHQDKNGWTPLHAACQNGDEDTTVTLIKYGARVDTQNQDGKTPLFIATFLHKSDIVKLLLYHKANVNLSENNLWTPLHVACQEGQESIAELLLDNNADIDFKNDDGSTPLWTATVNGKVKIVQLLLRRKANSSVARNDGLVPLHVARNVEIAKELIKYEANVNMKDKDMDTPLHTAIDYGHTEVAEFLINNNAQVLARNKNGITPLHLACQHGYYDLVKLLLQKGTSKSVDTQTKEGTTGLMFASQKGHTETVKLLLEFHANPNLQEKESLKSPLMLAAGEGHVKVVQLLLSNKASLDLEDKNGMTAADIAQSNKQSGVYEELHKHFKSKPKLERSMEKVKEFKKRVVRALLPASVTMKKELLERKKFGYIETGTIYDSETLRLPHQAHQTRQETYNKFNNVILDTVEGC